MVARDSNVLANNPSTRPSGALQVSRSGILRRRDGSSDMLDLVLTYSIHQRIAPRAAVAENRFTSKAPMFDAELPLANESTASLLSIRRAQVRGKASFRSYDTKTISTEAQIS